jgi:hypothetical protein
MDDWGEFWTPWATGSAHAISDRTPEESVIDQLHKVIEEVTGKPVEQPAPRKIGFY